MENLVPELQSNLFEIKLGSNFTNVFVHSFTRMLFEEIWSGNFKALCVNVKSVQSAV